MKNALQGVFLWNFRKKRKYPFTCVDKYRKKVL